MIEIRFSRPGEEAAQKRLWQEAFGDSDADIALFYETCWRPEEMLLLLEDGIPVSMTALLPHTLSLPDGGEASACYVYALATARARRGMGFARRLLAEADRLLRDRETDCLTVVPAQPSLHSFFASAGFQPCFSTCRAWFGRETIPAPAAGDRCTAAGPEEYGAARARCLTGTASVRYGERLLRFQQGMCRLSGGGLFRLTAGGAEGCAAAEYRDGGLLVLKELLLPPECLERGLALLAQALPAQEYEVRTSVPLPGWTRWEFGRIKWFDRDKEVRFGPAGYMGLGFD